MKTNYLISKSVRFTHCNEKQFAAHEMLVQTEHSQINCCECSKPILVRATDGNWYYVGERVFTNNTHNTKEGV